jgi:hypothetical protein
LQLGEEFEIVEVIEDYSDDEDRSSIQIDINQSPQSQVSIDLHTENE